MKKTGFILLFCLLLLIVLVGWQNKQKVHSTPTVERIDNTDCTVTADTPNGNTNSNMVVREYPDLGIFINAECLSPTNARNIPAIRATFSTEYFAKMVQDILLARYPEASESRDNQWYAFSPINDSILAYLGRGEGDDYRDQDRVAFMDSKLDINGGTEVVNTLRYHYFLDKSMDDEIFSSDDAMQRAIEDLKPYTDFDLEIYNSIKETDEAKNACAYRFQVQLVYDEVPVSTSGPDWGMGIDIVEREEGCGYLTGTFNFSQIQEVGTYEIISLNDALAAFEKMSSGQAMPGKWNIEYIQLEYCPVLEKEPHEYSFRPVWCFYGVYDGDYYSSLRIYADTGEFCHRS